MRQKQPNSKHCFVCGVENKSGLNLAFYDTAPGHVEARWNARSDFQGFPGIVHGGIIAAALDEAATRTVFGANRSARLVVTASLEIRYRRPVPINTELMITGSFKEDKGEIILAESKIQDQDGQILATANAVLVETPSHLTKTLELSPDEWKVYPDGAEE